MANRLQNFHISPENWPRPEPFRLGRPLAPRLPVGAGGVNHPQDVAELTDGLLSLGGLGMAGWLPRTSIPNSKLNAAIAGFQKLNSLEPDGLVNPDGPTLGVLSGYLPIPKVGSITDGAPTVEAAALNPRPGPEPLAGRGLTTRGIGDTLAEVRAEAAFEAERRAKDPFGDIFGGRREDPVIAAHVDKWLAEDAADIRTQKERDAAIGSSNASVEQMNYAIGDAGADRLGMRLTSLNNSQRDQIIDITMGHEGELSKDKKTNFGIQQNTLNDYNAMNPDAGFKEDMALLKREQAAQIYREMFYDRYGIGEIDNFSMASHLFDLVVLHGPTGAAMVLQDAMRKTFAEHASDLAGIYGEDDIPGSTLTNEEMRQKLKIGGMTLDILSAIDERGLLDRLQNYVVERRIQFMRDIAERDPEKAKNLPGWIPRAESFRP